jgi:menaquinone-dependent protoporphyrinogen oxidase
MARILIACSTVDGHTLKICERIAAVLRDAGDDADIRPIDDGGGFDVLPYDRIVIGASIRYGRHRRQVNEFIAEHREALDAVPSAFFSVNVVARKPGKDRPETNPYLQKFLRSIDWQPQLLGVFAGKIDYPRYGFRDRVAIRFIMWMTKGPTDPTAVVEFTDWDRVGEFARRVRDM